MSPPASRTVSVIGEALGFLNRAWGLAESAIAANDPSKLRRVGELLDELETEKVYTDGEDAARAMENGEG